MRHQSLQCSMVQPCHTQAFTRLLTSTLKELRKVNFNITVSPDTKLCLCCLLPWAEGPFHSEGLQGTRLQEPLTERPSSAAVLTDICMLLGSLSGEVAMGSIESMRLSQNTSLPVVPGGVPDRVTATQVSLKCCAIY